MERLLEKKSDQLEKGIREQYGERIILVERDVSEMQKQRSNEETVATMKRAGPTSDGQLLERTLPVTQHLQSYPPSYDPNVSIDSYSGVLSSYHTLHTDKTGFISLLSNHVRKDCKCTFPFSQSCFSISWRTNPWTLLRRPTPFINTPGECPISIWNEGKEGQGGKKDGDVKYTKIVRSSCFW